MKSRNYKTNLSILLEECFKSAIHPLSFKDIEKFLTNYKLKPNKSSIYRQLDKLIENQYLRLVQVCDCNLWELNSKKHAHFVCNNCSRVICIAIDQNYLSALKIDQNLEIEEVHFKGVCQNCCKTVN
jgi:Fe2+ or Zn2+ uptake regulation protein